MTYSDDFSFSGNFGVTYKATLSLSDEGNPSKEVATKTVQGK